MKRDDSVYLRHIIDAAARIEEYIDGVSEAQFHKIYLIQDGVIRQLEIIGEAVKRLSDECRLQYNDIPWKDIAGMRDKLIHDYFGVDLGTVWLTAVRDMPWLTARVEHILNSSNSC